MVATTGGALPEVVGPDGHAALLVAPGDPQAMADAIALALGDPRLRDRMGAAGRARVVARYTWHAVARHTADVYRQAIDAHRRTG